MMWDNNSKDVVEPVMTLSALFGLNIPCMASRLPPNTGLGSLKRLGFPFNMSENTLNRHFSYSSKNLMEGRYYTCLTCLFNHAGADHFKSNMIVLLNYGYSVHVRYGRPHMLNVFFGGGLAGCAAQFSLYIYQKIQWENIFPSPNTWKMFGDSFVSPNLHIWKRKALSNVFTHVNSWRPCMGCSAALSSLMAVQACCNILSLTKKLEDTTVTFDWNMLNKITQVLFTGLVIYEDVRMLLGSTAKDKGLIGSLVAYSVDGVGHAAHVGGFVFGLLYFGIVLYKKRP